MPEVKMERSFIDGSRDLGRSLLWWHAEAGEVAKEGFRKGGHMLYKPNTKTKPLGVVDVDKALPGGLGNRC